MSHPPGTVLPLCILWIALLIAEGCGLWPTMPGVLQCTWGDTLRAGNTLTFATRSLVTVADPGPAIQLSTVTDCSELYQQQLDGIASVTAYTFVNVRVSIMRHI